MYVYIIVYVYCYIYIRIMFFCHVPITSMVVSQVCQARRRRGPRERVSACGGGKIHGTSTIFYLVNSYG